MVVGRLVIREGGAKTLIFHCDMQICLPKLFDPLASLSALLVFGSDCVVGSVVCSIGAGLGVTHDRIEIKN